MPRFVETLYPSPFGFFDSDPIYQWDADRMVVFVLRKLGEDILSVELTKKMIWACLEEATREFNGLMIEYQAISNLASLLGFPTGSINTNNPLSPNNINLTNIYIQPNLEFLERQSDAYSALIGLGGVQNTYSGSITLNLGRQDYDLYTELKLDDGTPISSLQPSGSSGKIQVYEVYHFAPINYMYNSNMTNALAANGVGAGNYSSYVQDTRFAVLPVFEDVLRGMMLETAQRVRRSHYSYRISGRQIRIFPIPTNLVEGYNDKLWIRVGFKHQPLPSLADTIVVSGTIGNGSVGSGTIYDDSIFGIANPANVPFGLIDYKTLNPWSRNWIAEYTLALCKELLGLVRTKFKTFPIPGAELQLNGEDLITQGREDKIKLLDGLKEKLDNLTYDKLQERAAAFAENLNKQLQYIPIPPTWAIKMG